MKRINSIPEGRFQGYIWMSDQKEPDIYDNRFFQGIRELKPSNPFISEAYFFDKDNNASYSVRMVDGNYIAYRFLVSDHAILESEDHYFIPSFKDAPGALHFKELWHPVPDPLCEGMDVLVPGEFVFLGFQK